MNRRRLLAAGAVAVALLLGGCGGLSRSGPVEQGLDVGSGNPPDLRVTFPGPVPGASQEEIVRGFLRAGAASDAAYDNARAFLMPKASEGWNPDGTIVLLADAASPRAELVDPATVRVTASSAGTVTADGRYTAARPASTVTATFRLTTANGEWRVAELPKGFGRWIASTDVTRLVRPYQVHYVSTSRRAMVSDVRWFPVDKLATRLARAQLDPVPDHLVGAATSAVPAGARLLGDAVSVESGVATVNLISSKLSAGETNRQNLWAQFVTTLTQDTSVARVALSVNGVPVDLQGIQGSAGTLSEIGFSVPDGITLARPVARRGDAVVVYDPAALGEQEPREPAGARSYPSVPQEFRRLALSSDGGELAAVDPGGNGVSRWRGANPYEVPVSGTAVGSPSYDRRGFLWLGAVGRGDAKSPRLWVVNTAADPAGADAAATPVEADWLAGRRVLEARVAPDGDRIAVLSTQLDGRGTRIDLSGVVRTGGGLPQRLAAPLRLAAPVTQATGLAWLDDLSLATIGVMDGKTLQPVVFTAGGEVRGLNPVRDAVAITSTGGERDLWVVTSAGRLFGRAGSQWVDSGPATDLAVAAG